MAGGTRGFTLVEVVVAMGLSGAVVATALTGFSYAARQTRAGAYQIVFTAQGRLAAQKIVRYIEDGKAVGLATNGLNIVTLDLVCSRIAYQDGDGNPDTVADNRLVYDPDIATSGGERSICSHVSEIAGTPMFSLIPAAPTSAAMAFHLGDGSNAADRVFSGTGEGYQGIEVRVSGTPRNLQRWYD